MALEDLKRDAKQFAGSLASYVSTTPPVLNLEILQQ